MKTNGYTFKNSSRIMLALGMVLLVLFSSCKKENAEKSGSFALKDNPTSLKATTDGVSQTYTVIANGAWKVEPLTNANWVTIAPMEGNGDGTFTVTVNENTTLDDRSLILTFMVNDKRPNVSLKIEQDGRDVENEDGEPFLTLEGGSIFETTAEKITEEFTIRSNGLWKIKLLGEENWASISHTEGSYDGTFSVTVDKNLDSEPRTMDIAFFLNGVQHSNVLTINQEAGPDEGKVVFYEDFSWLEYGSSILYTSTGEKRIDGWTGDEMAKGWTSTINPTEGSGNQPLVYSRPGFVKLGKTSYGGDFISPKLSEVKGTKNLVVKFKAIPYQTKAGTRDDNILRVNIIGPGTINTAEFVIDNWPDYDLDPNCTEIWKESEAERSFVITGATAETQIRFLGGAFDLRPSEVTINKNRIFLDDIIVTVK